MVELKFKLGVFLLVLLFSGLRCTEASTTQSIIEEHEVKGYISRLYGQSNYNRCAQDPVGQFMHLDRSGDILGFHRNGFPSTDYEFALFGAYQNHYQGVARLQVANRHYMLITMDQADNEGKADDESGVLGLIHIANGDTDGLRLRATRTSTRRPDWNVIPNPDYYRVEWFDNIGITAENSSELDHLGFPSTIGNYAVLPVYDGDADDADTRIVLMDFAPVTDPWDCPNGSTYDAAAKPHCPRLRWSWIVEEKTGVVAITRLHPEDPESDLEMYMLITVSGGRVNFYISPSGLSLTANNLFGSPRREPDASIPRPEVLGSVENGESANLITDCATGQLYLVSSGSFDDFGRAEDGWDEVIMFEVNFFSYGDGTYSASMTQRIRILPNCGTIGGFQCNFKSGGTTYIDPDGRILLYATHQEGDQSPYSPGDDTVPMMEFRPHIVNDKPDTVGVQDECDTLEKSYVKMFNTNNWTGIPYMLDFKERDDRSINFDTAYSYSNMISSVQWCLPGTRANDGSKKYRYKLFVDEDGSGDAFYLNGTGVMRQYSFSFSNPRWDNTFESGFFCEWMPERNICERL